MKPLIAGNWKMNGLASSAAEIRELVAKIVEFGCADRDILICPPATLLAGFVKEFAEPPLVFGGQDCHQNETGAHTGEVSAQMLSDLGACFVIVGHSERRADHGETDALVKAKSVAALGAGLTPVICVGETEQDRKSRRHEQIVGDQLNGSLPSTHEKIVVAYEPVWAIGTGLTPTLEDISAMHGFIRDKVGPATRILYGGSVKPGNAKEILSLDHVDGALVGGASLKADDFFQIIAAAPGYAA